MPESILVRCGGCEGKIKAAPKYQGRKVNCPQCGIPLRIPVIAEEKPKADSVAVETSQTRDSAGDDDFANFDLTEYEDDGAVEDYGDLDDPPETPKPTPKSRAAGSSKSRKKKTKKKKKAAPSVGSGIYIDPQAFGGLAVMLFGGGLFWWAWIHGFIWPWAGIICIAGLIGMLSGIFGFGD